MIQWMPYGKGDPKLLPNFGSSDYLLGLLAGRQMIFFGYATDQIHWPLQHTNISKGERNRVTASEAIHTLRPCIQCRTPLSVSSSRPVNQYISLILLRRATHPVVWPNHRN